MKCFMRSFLMNKFKIWGISIFVLTLVVHKIGYSQELHTPYPIIFIHGLNDNYKSWYGPSGPHDIFNYDNVIDYLRGGDTQLQDGGTLNIALNCSYKERVTSLSASKIDDVKLYKTPNFKFGDFYTINFDVKWDGTDLSNIPGITSYDDADFLFKEQKTIQVSNSALFLKGDILRMDDEFMQVTNVNSTDNILTVDRSKFGSQIADHIPLSLPNICWNLSNESNQAAVVKQGWGLKLAIDEIKKITGSSKVILVGHSMGGLAAREYIRSYYNHVPYNNTNDVAKLVTIGTPHLGSNATEFSPLINNYKGIDNRSDAARDLRYNYSGINTDPQPPYKDSPDNSTFLFGGTTEYELSQNTNFYNPDVNANGIIEDSLLPGSELNNIASLPNSINYSWIVSTDTRIFYTDGCVRWSRQFPWFEGAPNNIKRSLGNIIDTYKFHSDEEADYFSLLRGLDEPDDRDPKLAYIIGPNSKNKGFITYQEGNDPNDIDLYKIILDKDGILKINVLAKQSTGIKTIYLCDKDLTSIKELNDINGTIEERVNANTYFIWVSGIANPTTYQYPYTLITQFESSALSVSSIRLNFNDVLLNSVKSKIIQLTNNKLGASLKTNLKITDNDADQFTVTPNLPFELEPNFNSITNLTVTFNPTSVGPKVANLVITTEDLTIPPKIILLRGNGTNLETKLLNSNIEKNYYNYGFSKTYETKNKIFILYNGGTSPLTFSNLTLSGIHSDQFDLTYSTPFHPNQNIKGLKLSETPQAISSSVPFDLAPGDSILCNIQFTPKSIGSKSASFEFISNSDNGSTFNSISLNGSGTKNQYSGNNNVITMGEYWFDERYESKKAMPIPGYLDTNINLSIPTYGILAGLHSLHIRYKDSKGKWSAILSEFFHKMPVTINGVIRYITTCEYWFDDSYASKVSTPITPGQTISLTSGIDVTSLPNGLHSYHVRYKDDAGQWSSVVSEFFYKMPVNASTNNYITTYRYWFDSDDAHMIKVTLPNPINPYFLIKDLNTCNLAQGDHTVHFQFSDLNRTWSSVVSEPISKGIILAPVVTPDGATTICDGTTRILTSTEAGSYLWNTGETTQSISVTKAGDYYVSVDQESGCGLTSDNTVVHVNPRPIPPTIGSITQPDCIIETGSVTLNGLPDSWTLTSSPGNAISSGTGSSTTANLVTGSYTFSVANANGCTSIASDIAVIDNQPLPAANKQLIVGVFLEGAFNAVTGFMHTTLNDHLLIPKSQPYNVAPWNYFGTEHVTNIPSDVVDWVLVELRQAATAADALPSTALPGWPKAYFLKTNGSIVDLDGTSIPTIGNPSITAGNNLFIIVRHRNSIAIISSTGMQANCDDFTYNFKDAMSKAHGNSAGYKLLSSGVYGMVSGDADSDGTISVNDFTKWATDFGKTNMYLNSDIDFDGQISVNDFTKWATNFGIGNVAPLRSLDLQTKDVQPPLRYKSQVPGN